MEATTDSLLTQKQDELRKSLERLLGKRVCRRIKKQFRILLSSGKRIPTVWTPSTPRIKVELLLERSAEVELVQYLGYTKTGYAICPKCGYALEREYQQHCEVCGQLLGWKKFSQGEITVQRKIVLSKEDRNAVRPDSIKSEQSEQHFLRWKGLKDGRRSYYSIKKKGRAQSGSVSEKDQCVCERRRNV